MLRFRQTDRCRDGFTLIEMLVVIGIMAALMAIAVGAYFRVEQGQNIKRSETTVKKVATGLNGQWNAVIDDVKNEIKNGRASSTGNPTLWTDASSDRDRANALWLKLRLRQEFPQTFLEASTPYTTVGIQTKPVFTQAIGPNTNPNNLGWGITPNDHAIQSAILLYLTLTQVRRGAGFNADDIGAGSTTMIVYPAAGQPGSRNYNVFIDAWGNPIGFERWALSGAVLNNAILTELSGPPYVPSGTTSLDPQDPFNKVPGTTHTVLTSLQLRTTAQNYSPVIYSWGPDKKPSTNDDILSFRIMPQGQRGN